MHLLILISFFLFQMTITTSLVYAQNLLESNYFEWKYQRHTMGGVTRYMTFHNHQVNANVPYHQHLNYDPFSTSTEIFSRYQLGGQYYLNTRVMVQFQAPLIINKRLENTVVSSIQRGLGDLTFIGKYHLYNSKLYSNNTMRSKLFLIGAGLVLPTGTFDNFDENNEAEPHLQTGSGTINFLFTTDYQTIFQAWQVQLNGIYQFNRTNSYTYHFGNKTTISLLISRHFDKKDALLIPSLGLIFNYLQNDEMNGQAIVEDTQRQVLWATAGMQFRYRKIELYGQYQQKVVERIEGIQPNNRYQLQLGLRYILPKQKLITTVE